MINQTNLSLVKEFIAGLSEFTGFEVYNTTDGVSTEVYQLTNGKDRYYLRLADEGEASSPEVLAHRLMLEKGVLVPEVIRFEDFNEFLHRSYYLTGEIKGKPAKRASNLKQILFEAGKQLALINTIPVKNFGWIDVKKPAGDKLTGICRDYHDFQFDQFFPMLEQLVADGMFTHEEGKQMKNFAGARQNYLTEYTSAHLVHGDFALEHIFSDQGKYSGIIDFGDIRGASIYHDLAHFYFFDANQEHFDNLVAGYREVTSLPDDYPDHLRLEVALIAVAKLWFRTHRYLQTIAPDDPSPAFLKKIISEQF